MGCYISEESEGALSTASQFRKCSHVWGNILYFPATLMIENYNKKAFVSSVQHKIQLLLLGNCYVTPYANPCSELMSLCYAVL